MYEMENKSDKSSLLLNSILTGGFCSRALIKINKILEVCKILNTSKNINIVCVLSILFS